MNKFTDIKSFEVKAVNYLFKQCGVLIVQHEFDCTEYVQGQLRVYSLQGNRLEFCANYANLSQFRETLAEAMALAGTLILDVNRDAGV